MKLNTKRELDEAIVNLEKRKLLLHERMVFQYHQTAESLKPGNLIKGAVSSIIHSPGARSSIVKTIAGIGVGLLTKRLFIGKSQGIIQTLIGNALKLGVAKTAISNTDKIKAYATSIYHNLFKKGR